MNESAMRNMLTLASYLEQMVKDEDFDLSTYYDFHDTLEFAREARQPVEVFLDGGCGTTACAWGYAPRLFPEVTVGVERIQDDVCDMPYEVWSINGEAYCNGLNAAGAFFGITQSATSWVFFPMTYLSDEWPQDRHAVALRLRVLVANRGKVPEKSHFSHHSGDV